MNGSIMGMTKAEIRNKFDEIVDFSGIEKYVDTPVKRYSSGMLVRLGFAIAAHLEPEILVIDEVLAVGDAEFQKKALGKMKDVSINSGRTVLFVSHNMAAIQSLCNTGLLLDNGLIEKEGTSHDVVQYYFSNGINIKKKPQIEKFRTYNIKGSPIIINEIYIKNHRDEIPTIPMNQAPVIVISVVVRRRIKNANISLALFNIEGIKTDLAFSLDDDFYLNCDEGKHEIEFTQRNFSLSPGQYTIGVGINQSTITAAWDGIVYYPIFEIANQNNISNWDLRIWAVHHTQNNHWKLLKTT